MLVFVVAMLAGIGLLVWPKIEANWFAPPAPERDIRPLRMTNEEVNNCYPPSSWTVLPLAHNASALIPALLSLEKSGVIYEIDPLLRRIIAGDAVPFWAWNEEDGLIYGISDGPSSTIYKFSIYCTTEVEGIVYPLYDTVEVSTIE